MFTLDLSRNWLPVAAIATSKSLKSQYEANTNQYANNYKRYTISTMYNEAFTQWNLYTIYDTSTL